jgi:hypothetical protein
MVQFGREEVVMLSGGGAIVRVNVFVAVADVLSVTTMVKLAPETAAVGVPEITPPDRVNPAGKLLPVCKENEYGPVPPVAASGWL